MELNEATSRLDKLRMLTETSREGTRWPMGQEDHDALTVVLAELARLREAATPWRAGPARGGGMPSDDIVGKDIAVVYLEFGEEHIDSGQFGRSGDEWLTYYNGRSLVAIPPEGLLYWCPLPDLIPAAKAEGGGP